MTPSNHHVILRQIFELEFAPGSDGFALQQEIAQVVQEKLLPQLEALFDRMAGPDELIRIEKLQIDIGRISPSELGSALVSIVVKQLEEQLQAALLGRQEGVERLPVADGYLEQWLYYLEHGHLPRYAARTPESTVRTAVLEKLATEQAAIGRFRRLMSARPPALLRLVRQHEEPFLVSLLETLTANSQRTLPDYRQETLRWQAGAREGVKQSPLASLPPASPAQRYESFWTTVIELALRQSAAPQTAENLFAGWLHRLYISAGPARSVLLEFWQEVTRFGRTSYPLLQAALMRQPELLSRMESPSAFQPEPTPDPGGRPEGETHARADSVREAAPDRPTSPTTAREEKGEERFRDGTVDKNTAREMDDQAVKQGAEPVSTPEAEKAQAGHHPPDTATGPASGDPGTPVRETPSAVAPPGNDERWPVSGDRKIHTEDRPNNPRLSAPKTIPPATQSSIPAQTGDFWYVSNAGIVLLHPFMMPYFNSSGLLDNRDFVSEDARHKAVHLLHYLATGQTRAPEYDLVLPRFLCDLPFDLPLQRFIEVNPAEQQEGENLLAAAIRHWNKLGNTSPAGLREGFLQRDGKLELREAGWYLSVEQKTMDILLDFLPWNLSMIKLPWMPGLLRVEWA